MRRIWIPQTIAVASLAWALYPRNPYGYYVFLRWICSPVFAYLAVKSSHLRREAWTWIFGALAVVYNPIFRVHATRDFWEIVNVGTIGVVIASMFVLRNQTASDAR